jgi:hypothetical protein
MTKGRKPKVWQVIAGAALLLGIPALAMAADAGDTCASLYGNTLVSVDGGIESHFWYKPDHTFTGSVPQFYFRLKGTWSQNPDGTICRVFDPPLPMVKNPDCGPVLVHKPGDSETDAHGDSEKLVAGIV